MKEDQKVLKKICESWMVGVRASTTNMPPLLWEILEDTFYAGVSCTLQKVAEFQDLPELTQEDITNFDRLFEECNIYTKKWI